MKTLPKKKKMVNHVAFLLDASGSMMGIQDQVRETFAKLMDGLQSEAKKIETRVHVYSFGYNLVSHVVNATPKQAAAFVYGARNEGTALIDSTMELVDALKVHLNGDDDSSMLVYAVTDGGETENGAAAPKLRSKLGKLNDDWTMAIFVPNEACKTAAGSYGFPVDNIEIW